MLPEAGRREQRSGLLPAHGVAFRDGMAVFRDGYAEVLRRLTGSLPFMRAWHKEWVVPTTGGYFAAAGPGWVKHH
jgi:hypothetical protein